MNNSGTSDDLVPVTEDSNPVEGPAGDTPIMTIAKSLEEKKRIFKERARRLAQRPSTEASQDETLELIEFMLAHERYAIEVAYVREVYPLKDMTPVPCNPVVCARYNQRTWASHLSRGREGLLRSSQEGNHRHLQSHHCQKRRHGIRHTRGRGHWRNEIAGREDSIGHAEPEGDSLSLRQGSDSRTADHHGCRQAAFR